MVLFALLGGVRAFERASVTTIKSLLAWVAALGGIVLALLLILSGRGGIALGPLVMFGPLLWQEMAGSPAPRPSADGGGPARRTPAAPGRDDPQGSLRGARPAAPAPRKRRSATRTGA